MPKKRAIVQQALESLDAEIPFADVFVAIDARVERLERIIQMKRDDALDADVLVELGESALVAFVAGNVVAGGERVLGIEA